MAPEPRPPSPARTRSRPPPLPATDASDILVDPFAAEASDDWYVGINGVCVGPLRLGELRGKAASGKVTYASLVWRVGLEDWQPLTTFPELTAVLEECISSARGSLAAIIPPALPGGSAFSPEPGSNGGTAVAADVARNDATSGATAQSRMPATAWIAIAAALALGLTIGFVLFGAPPSPSSELSELAAARAPEVLLAASSAAVHVPDPGSVALREVAGSAVDDGSEVRDPSDILGEAAAPDPSSARQGSRSLAAPAEPASQKGRLALEGLAVPQAAGPTTKSSAPAAVARKLESAEVERVVQRYATSVRRSCWQPALDTRESDAPTSARVSVTISITPAGRVADVRTSGEPKGYRGLSTCIASRVRTWEFPASSESTTVNVPFVFAAQ
jgi:hypothetical protein